LGDNPGFAILKRGQYGLINRIHGTAYVKPDLKPFSTKFGTSLPHKDSTRGILSLMGDMDVEISVVEEIPKSSSGKVQAIIRKFPIEFT